VGLGYGLRYADLANGQHVRLVFEAVSRPGKGQLIFTANGSTNEQLLNMAQGAMEWAMVRRLDAPTSPPVQFESSAEGLWARAALGSWQVKRTAIAADLGMRPGPAMLSGTRDVHVNMPNLWVGAEVVRQYAPAIAVAIASLASGRLPRPDVAMVGYLDFTDDYLPSVPAVTQPVHVSSLVAQGFRQLMVPEREAVADGMVGLLGEAGIELWVNVDPDATFSSALLNVFGLPHTHSAEPAEDREEADMVRTHNIAAPILSISAWRGPHPYYAFCTAGGCCQGRRPGSRRGAARSDT
jgi:hypothetical protein